MSPKRKCISNRRPSRSRQVQPLTLERLEARCMLDGGLVTLIDDVLDVQQNSGPDTLDVLANDQFDGQYTGAGRITSISYGSEGGSLSLSADGQSVVYAPPADFFGTETFFYVVDNDCSAQVHVNVLAPLAFDEFEIPPDGLQRTLDVLANDPFWQDYAGPREITSISVTSAGGDAAIAADRRSILYTPPEGAYGKDEFIYIVDHIYPARVTISIPEVLEFDQLETVQHTPKTFHLLANDPFWPAYDGDRRITHVLDVDDGATVSISSDGQSVTYTPAPDARYSDSFRYVVDSTYEAYASVRIHQPVQNDWFDLDENSTNQPFDVIGNDTYRDLNRIRRDVIDRVTDVTQPASGGSVSISTDGQSVIYTPPAGFTGSDTFTYLADDLHEATVNVLVNRPVRDDYISQGVYQDTPDAILTVLSNDFLGNGYVGPRLITDVGPTEQGGTVTIGGGGRWLVYTPADGHTGSDSFRYTVDGQLDARVTLTVRSLAQGDYYRFKPDPAHGPYLIDVLSNDHFRNGYQGPGVITAVGPVSGSGEVVQLGGPLLSFVPGPTGHASFSYTVDNNYEAHVTVTLYNYLAGDSVAVDQNSDPNTIDVLANDFRYSHQHGDYQGPRRITEVSDSQQGGVVTISDGGAAVQYQPPADFFGADSFTYSVDGIMQTTVSVHVIRRVRDDLFRVDPEAADQSLPVLVNDLFNADYQGPRQITAVSAPSGGGTVSIAADGRAVVYTAAADFTGTDTFVYTVDGRLKAEVQVRVDADATNRFPTFGSLAEYQQFLIDDALVRYQYLFGQPAWYGWTENTDTFPTTFDGTAGRRDHSETNVQVAGVDEGDIIEFDADYVYVLSDDGLVIVDAWPAEQAAVASRLDIEGRPVAEFLAGDRLTIISEIGGNPFPWYEFGGDAIDFGAADVAFLPPYPPQPSTTLVTVIDVADRTAPTVVQTTSMEGRYVDSRAVDGFVYVLVSNPDAVAAPPLVIPQEDPQDDENDLFFPQGTYETREAYLERVTANPGDLVDGALPNYTAYGPDGEMVRTGLLNDPEGIYQPLLEDARNLISVVSFNINSDEPGLASTSAVYATGASTIYASLHNFYVFDQAYTQEDGAVTQIMQFDWDTATGGVDFVAATTVAGTMLNQFSADEFAGQLRIATTINNVSSGNWSNRDTNNLFVLEEDAGVFEFVGSMQNLALDQSIRSVRFMGDRALLTTFENVDPLFGIDLSDPTNPQALGHLTLPGFTEYMQFIDDTHLLTVGQNTPNGFGPTQVILFDVSDLTQPIQLAEHTFERFSTSEAQIDHHAFGYFATHGLLAMPTSRTYVERVDEDGDGYRETRKTVREDQLSVLNIDTADGASAISLAGEIAHDTAVRRSGYIDQYLFSMSASAVKVAHVDQLEQIVADVDITDPNADPPDPVVIPTEPAPTAYPATVSASALAEAVDDAQVHLATQLQAQSGVSALVSAEAAGGVGGASYRLVLRAGDSQYLYYVRGDDSVLLANDAYAFAEGEQGSAWHAIQT
ncbi:MAG: beta-propeller domain-containing protein, partial [Bythopirellula sp.]